MPRPMIPMTAEPFLLCGTKLLPGVLPVPPVRRHRAARQHATPSLFVLQSIEHVFDEAPIPRDRRLRLARRSRGIEGTERCPPGRRAVPAHPTRGGVDRG